ncbi:DUF2304 domain-containing protein [Candidatus Nomurabacteria bacterium]|nr:DUF2304 domain-containing protein [Candidatus Nomurabacteria bacterium]
MWLQILITIFIVLILAKVFRQWRQERTTLFVFLSWSFLWLAILLVFWVPEITSYLANFLGVGRGADLIIYLSIVVIFYLIFKIFIRLNKTDRQITKLVREDAINNAEKR